MGRRGPDHTAHRQWRRDGGRNIYLLHSRLNIIDLDDRANQPFGVGSKWMVYNGELYNYLELRCQLKESGRGFITESDTEVLLHTLDHHGWKGLDDCEGMWAFAVYDEDDGSLMLGRDRFGEKPLYLYRDESGLYFASEVKFIGREGDLIRIGHKGTDIQGAAVELTADGFMELPAGTNMTLALELTGATTPTIKVGFVSDAFEPAG